MPCSEECLVFAAGVAVYHAVFAFLAGVLAGLLSGLYLARGVYDRGSHG